MFRKSDYLSGRSFELLATSTRGMNLVVSGEFERKKSRKFWIDLEVLSNS
jgi:hypothetical protein